MVPLVAHELAYVLAVCAVLQTQLFFAVTGLMTPYIWTKRETSTRLTLNCFWYSESCRRLPCCLTEYACLLLAEDTVLRTYRVNG
jgi:hypothetical protein